MGGVWWLVRGLDWFGGVSCVMFLVVCCFGWLEDEMLMPLMVVVVLEVWFKE